MERTTCRIEDKTKAVECSALSQRRQVLDGRFQKIVILSRQCLHVKLNKPTVVYFLDLYWRGVRYHKSMQVTKEAVSVKPTTT